MKKTLINFCTSCALLVALVCGILSSCVPTEEEFSVTFKNAGPGYVTVMATVPTPTEVAYTVETEPLENPSDRLIFMTGTKTTFNASGEQQLLAEIKEGTKYYLYLVARLSATAYSQVYTFEFDATNFTFNEMCTVVAVMNDGYKMHISVPASVKNSPHGKAGGRAIRYTQADLMFYNLNKQKFDDYYMLLTNNGMFVTEDKTVQFSEDVNFTQSTEDLNEDGVVDEEDMTYMWNPISPGEPVVFLAGEYEWMELPEEYQSGGALQDKNYVVDGWEYPAGWSAGYYLPMIDGKKYDDYYATKSMNIITDANISHPLDNAWNPGSFQKKCFRTRVPDPLNGKVEMEIVELGPVDATIALTPDPNVLFYSVMLLDEGTYGELLKLLDYKEEYLQWATASFFAMYNFGTRTLEGDSDLVLSDYLLDVPADTKYHLFVTGMGDAAGSKQCFHHYTFNTPQKTKAYGPTIIVEPLEDKTTPFEAFFKIKCTSPENPVVKCSYGANYIKDWVYAINGGGTYLSYGQQASFSATEVAKINSEEGLEVSFPSIDGETTRLVVVGFNDENTPNDLNYEIITDCPAVAEVTTPFFEAEFCGLYYDVKSALAGDWTMTATVLDSLGNKVTATKNVSILSEYTDFPSGLTDEVYDIYHEHTKWTDDEIRGYWKEFEQNVQDFNKKRLEFQNKLALIGWLDGGVDVAYQTMMPYDLFISETISTVDVKSMFNDFGPKMYIEVAEDESGKAKLTITADMVFGAPVMNWSDPFYLAARSEDSTNNTVFYYADPTTGYYASPLVFDVEYSDDYQTLTIKALDYKGTKFYPNVIGQDSRSGRYLLDYPIVSDVVLTKGKTAQPVMARKNTKAVVDPQTRELNISHKQYTRFDKPAKKVEMKVMTQEKAHANYEKYLRLMNNKSKNE